MLVAKGAVEREYRSPYFLYCLMPHHDQGDEQCQMGG